MADVHQLIVTCIIYLYQIYLIFRSINPLKKDALLLVLHNFLLYYVINMFKRLAQTSMGSSGPVNTFYYVPLVYEETVSLDAEQDSWHQVLRSSTWQFFETLFRHHLALLLSFNMALIVPRCKLGFISTLVLASNFVMFVCFTSAIWQLLMCSGQANVNALRLVLILSLGPVCQALLGCRLLSRMWVGLWIVV
ncbi:uncharacterized protein LOC110185952 [Drosophila serrata]|uniref:uncharacterized protein LOC110185952 n=1 Tax=Drosophila serrata TaxID=7274 RepID=UPI000A1D0C76|nr:uncharacterized protein LOC110185952 [Drosophila serrata]